MITVQSNLVSLKHRLLGFVLTPIDDEIAPSIVALIVHGIVALWIVSCLAWIVRWLSLDWLSLNGLSLDWCSLWDELLRVWHSLQAGLNVLFLSDLLKFKRGKNYPGTKFVELRRTLNFLPPVQILNPRIKFYWIFNFKIWTSGGIGSSATSLNQLN